MQKIEFDGKDFRAKFDHLHYDPSVSELRGETPADVDRKFTEFDKAYQRALEKHQVELYGNAPIEGHPAPQFIFPVMRGVTRCTLLDDNNNASAEGYAFCSVRDNFNKKKGRQISLGRAIGALKRHIEGQS